MTKWAASGALLAMCCVAGFAQESGHAKPMPLNEIVDSLERAQQGARPVSYQVIREYRLSGAKDSKTNSEVIAEVNFRPPAHGDYRIQQSSGSDRGLQVVRRLLDHEAERASQDSKARTALNRDNYDFNYVGEAILDGQSCYVVELKPKRKEKELIAGQAWVDEHSFLVRQIDGELAKSPSWWIKNVRVKLGFDDRGGTWMQTNMEAVADVRIAGPHTLTSRIVDFRTADQVASVQTISQKRRSSR
jgi:outer membrane lipoprotein-sorting protein